MATKDRTALKDEFKNGNLATGERFADLIDSMKVVQLPVVDPQALGTSLSFIDSISQDADGKITATKKTLDLANAHELNPFKGWYKTGDTLPTDGFDGAYLYFKDTSELTGQTTIYRWNGTAYADTGTVVDTSNVQTFASGQAVNGVAIKGIDDEEVSGDADVLSAEAGERLNEQLYGVSFETILPSQDYDSLSFPTVWGSATDKIYYDTRLIISPTAKIKSLKLKTYETGVFKVYFIKKSDLSIVTYKEVTVTVAQGDQTFNIDLEDTYYENGEMYVGINSAKMFRAFSSGSTTSYTLSISTGVVSSSERGWGILITTESKTNGDVGDIQNNIRDLQDEDVDINSKISNINNLLFETQITPSVDWINGTFSVSGGGNSNYVYFDTRTLIPANATLDRVRMKATTSDNINVYLIKASDYTILASTTKSVVSGINDITPDFDESLFSVPTYIGVGTANSSIAMRSETSDYTYRVNVTTGVVAAIAYMISVEVEYTSIRSTKISEDLAEAITQGGNDIVLGPYDYEVTEPIVLTSGMTIRGSFGKTRLILTDGCQTAISASNANNIKISDLEIVGTCPNYSYEMNGIVSGTGYDLVETEANAIALDYMGDEKGIYLYYCENVVLENIKVNHITGSAIRVNHVGMNYIRGLNATNLFITNCYNGIYCENEHEFSQYTNWTITLCMIGMYIASGNLIFTAGHATRCRVGMLFVNGTNHAHGIVNGVELKHNQIAGLLCNSVIYGEFFKGVYLSYCSLIIRNSQGLYFDDVMTANSTIDATGTTINNVISKLVKRNSGVTIINQEALTIETTINLY